MTRRHPLITLRLLALFILFAFAKHAFAHGHQGSLQRQQDRALQAQLQRVVKSHPRWQKLARQGRLALGVVDLSGEQPRYAQVNGEVMMYAASLPKIAVLLAAYAAIENGELDESEALQRDLGAMIRVSSNGAATRVIDRLGISKIAETLSDPRYGFYDANSGGGLWVGKRYAKSGPRLPDPVNGISHGATVEQVCRFYYLLSEGQLINAQRSQQMLADLADPAISHKFVRSLKQRAPEARLYRKSGTWRDYHADSVLVQDDEWRNYILVAMVQSDEGKAVMAEIVPEIEALLQPGANAVASVEPEAAEAVSG